MSKVYISSFLILVKYQKNFVYLILNISLELVLIIGPYFFNSYLFKVEG